jgi:hypothetical protein
MYNGIRVPLDYPISLDELIDLYESQEIDEAEFKGKKVSIGKPKRGGSKKFYVYVKDGDKVKKVSFGDTTGLSAKLNNSKARQAFAARHDCKNKKDRTKASYWSCRLPRYAKLLGFKTENNKFIDDSITEYDKINYYDNELENINLPINDFLKTIIENSDEYLKNKIINKINSVEKTVYTNWVSPNKVNRIQQKKNILSYSKLIKTFESFKYLK